MKLYTFEVNQRRRLGAEWQEQLIDLAVAYEAGLQGPPQNRLRGLPSEMLSFLRIGPPALEAAQEALAFVKKRRALPVGEQMMYPIDGVRMHAPLARPGKILCCGNNYGGKADEEPVFFAKMASAIIGPGEGIIKPAISGELEAGMHLAAVIGRKIKNSTEEDVMASVFGYTILQDVCARAFEQRDAPMFLARNFDSFCPLGPCIVTADELASPGSVRLRKFLNGALMQEETTAGAIFPLPRLLSTLSRVMTLEPGDIIGMGSLAALGGSQPPAMFLRAGDTLATEMDGIGRLENPVVAE